MQNLHTYLGMCVCVYMCILLHDHMSSEKNAVFLLKRWYYTACVCCIDSHLAYLMTEDGEIQAFQQSES